MSIYKTYMAVSQLFSHKYRILFLSSVKLNQKDVKVQDRLWIGYVKVKVMSFYIISIYSIVEIL